MTPDARPPAKPRHGPKIVLGLAVVLLVPLALIFGLFPLLMDGPFDRVEELEVTNIQSLRVYILNRQGVDDGPDVGPYFAAADDYAPLLAALKQVPEVAEFTGARGPWLGEYRVVTTAGRRGTIRFYWQPSPSGDPYAAPVLRFQIGPNKFEGRGAPGLIAAAEAAKERGRAK